MGRKFLAHKIAIAAAVMLTADVSLAINVRAIGRELWMDLKGLVTPGSKPDPWAPRAHSSTRIMGDEASAVLPRQQGREVAIAHAQYKSDGSLVQTVMEAPPVFPEAASVSAELRVRNQLVESNFGVTREFGSGAVKNKISHSFRADTIDGKLVRVQTNESYETSHMRSRAVLEKNDLQLFLETKGTPTERLQIVRPMAAEEGRLIRFKFRGDGTSLSLFLLKDGQVTERVYAVEAAAGLRPGPDGVQLMNLGRVSTRKLTAEEIEKQGFFKVAVTHFPGRKEAGPAARGLQVREGAHH